MLIDTRLATITIQEGEDIITALHTAAADLCNAVESETVLRRMLKEAEADLTAAEGEMVTEANIAAQGKEGPLSGIATTSKAYTYALESLLANARNNGHAVGGAYRQVQRLRVDADNAAVAKEQASIRFSATKHAADLKAAIIRAIAL